MKRLVAVILTTVLGMSSFAFTLRFTRPDGTEMIFIREGESFCLVVQDPDKGACGISKFKAAVVIFDIKTGAYIDLPEETFQEFKVGSGIFFWADGAGRKRTVQVGGRKSLTDVTEMEHTLGSSLWQEGNWEYVDEDMEASFARGLMGDFSGTFPAAKKVVRFQYTHYDADLDGKSAEAPVSGRFENMDTLIAIVADLSDRRNVAAAQIKIWDTSSALTVSPTPFNYGCRASCETITVTITDPDENLYPDKIEAVPFFVIVNPGGFATDDETKIPPSTDRVTEICSLLTFGGALSQSRGSLYGPGDPIFQPIRWYNIYDAPVTYKLKSVSQGKLEDVPSRYIDYPNSWLDPDVVSANGGIGLGRVLFYAWETGPNTGVFQYKFGSLEQLQRALGFCTFPLGTTIAFHYIDPNDFDDFSLAWAEVGDRPHSRIYITNAQGIPITQIRIGEAIYVKVLDADANIEGCCTDEVTVHLCGPHGDCEWWFGIPEVGNNTGVFFSQSGMKLLPVWDAVGGYQLVWFSGTFEAYNEDTILVRYNSVKIVR